MNKMNKNKKLESKKSRNIILIALFTVAVLTVVLISTRVIDKKTESVASGGGIKILKSDLTDQAKFYPYEVNGTKMEVLAFRASDNTIRTALNTCQVCNGSGKGYYVQEGDVLVCQNCGNRFKADEVEIVKGGCNPVPIMKENKIEDDTTITINENFLAENTNLFVNWKK